MSELLSALGGGGLTLGLVIVLILFNPEKFQKWLSYLVNTGVKLQFFTGLKLQTSGKNF